MLQRKKTMLTNCQNAIQLKYFLTVNTKKKRSKKKTTKQKETTEFSFQKKTSDLKTKKKNKSWILSNYLATKIKAGNLRKKTKRTDFSISYSTRLILCRRKSDKIKAKKLFSQTEDSRQFFCEKGTRKKTMRKCKIHRENLKISRNFCGTKEFSQTEKKLTTFSLKLHRFRYLDWKVKFWVPTRKSKV